MAETYTTRRNASGLVENIQAWRNTRNATVVDTQPTIAVDVAGDPLGPALSATPYAPQSLGNVVWVEVVDLTSLRGCELQNDSDADMLYCYADLAPADSSDFGLKLKKGANRYFAPSRDSSYAGKIWARALVAGGKTLRVVAW